MERANRPWPLPPAVRDPLSPCSTKSVRPNFQSEFETTFAEGGGQLGRPQLLFGVPAPASGPRPRPRADRAHEQRRTALAKPLNGLAGGFGYFGGMRYLHLACAAAVLTLAACAQSPESIQPAYVSSVPYQAWTCAQLDEEGHHLTAALATASVQQSQVRTNDAIGVFLIGLPLSPMSGENIAPQIARLKGEQEAVRTAAVRGSCSAARAASLHPSWSGAGPDLAEGPAGRALVLR